MVTHMVQRVVAVYADEGDRAGSMRHLETIPLYPRKELPFLE